MKRLLVLTLCLACSGCGLVITPKKLRVGSIHDKVYKSDVGDDLEIEETIGITLQWWPD